MAQGDGAKGVNRGVSHHPFVGFQPLDEIAVQLELRVVHVFVLAAGLGLLHLPLEILPVPEARVFEVVVMCFFCLAGSLFRPWFFAA